MIMRKSAKFLERFRILNGIVYKAICQKGFVLNPSGRSLVKINLKKRPCILMVSTLLVGRQTTDSRLTGAVLHNYP